MKIVRTPLITLKKFSWPYTISVGTDHPLGGHSIRVDEINIGAVINYIEQQNGEPDFAAGGYFDFSVTAPAESVPFFIWLYEHSRDVLNAWSKAPTPETIGQTSAGTAYKKQITFPVAGVKIVCEGCWVSAYERKEDGSASVTISTDSVTQR